MRITKKKKMYRGKVYGYDICKNGIPVEFAKTKYEADMKMKKMRGKK